VQSTALTNAYIESFNGKLRAECLDQNWFETIEEARATLAAWRVEYNTERPHSALGALSPRAFVEEWKPTGTG
jgi:putative transposase